METLPVVFATQIGLGCNGQANRLTGILFSFWGLFLPTEVIVEKFRWDVYGD